MLNEAGQFAARQGDLAGRRRRFGRRQMSTKRLRYLGRKASVPSPVAVLSRHESAGQAAVVIDQGIQAVQRVEEAYDLLSSLAKRRRFKRAREVQRQRFIQRATDSWRSFSSRAQLPVKSGMIGALSQITSATSFSVDGP